MSRVRPGEWPLFSPEDEDLYLVKWHSCAGYAATRHPYARAHRVVLSRMLGRPLAPDEIADHINFIRHDNRRENLRVVTAAQNCQHRQGKPGSSSDGCRGVSFHKASGKWAAFTHQNSRKIDLGLFPGREAAAAAAAAKRAELGYLADPAEPAVSVEALKRPLHVNNTSGFPCVFRSRGGKWQAKFRYRRESYFIGVFHDPETAYCAVVAKQAELGIARAGSYATPRFEKAGHAR